MIRFGLIERYLFFQHLKTALLVFLGLGLIVLLSQFSNFSQYQSRVEGWGYLETLMISGMRTPALLQAILPHTILVSAAVSTALSCRRLEVAVLMQNSYSPTALILPTVLSAAALGLVFMLVVNPLAVIGHNTSEGMIRDLSQNTGTSIRKNPREVYVEQDEGAIFVLIEDVTQDAGLLSNVTYYAVNEDHVLQRTIKADEGTRIAPNRWQLADAVELYRAPDLTVLPPAEGFEIAFSARALETRFDPRDQEGFYRLPDRIALAEIVGAQTYEPRFRLGWLYALPFLLASLGYLSGAIVLRPLQRGGWKYDAALVLAAAFAVYTLSTVLEALAIRGVLGAVTAVTVVPLLAAVSAAALIWLKRGGNRILRNPFGRRAQAMQEAL